jgi:hypothetical protein
MRRSHHSTGSTAAQSTLQALVGWTPTRRSFLVAGAAFAAVATAAGLTALPAVAGAEQDGVHPGSL